MFNVIKKRAGYLKDSDPLRLKAADRLDRIKAAERSGPASETGPFAGKTSTPEVSGIHPAIAEEDLSGGSMSPMESRSAPAVDDPAAMADHHQKLADYFDKIAHPGSQTIPATTQLNDYEKSELSDDTDMNPKR